MLLLLLLGAARVKEKRGDLDHLYDINGSIVSIHMVLGHLLGPTS